MAVGQIAVRELMNLRTVTRRREISPVTAGRSVVVDSVRGLAILLMILDHLLVQLDPMSTLRAGAPWSITRLALPLFMLASAAVWRPSRRVRWRLWAAVFPEAVLMVMLGMQWPGVVVVILLVLSLLDVLPDGWRNWYVLGVLGLVQALYVPIGGGWEGYQPGLVLAWFCLGRLACFNGSPLAWLPRSFAPIGRRPLAWYFGHLVALVLVVGLAS